MVDSEVKALLSVHECSVNYPVKLIPLYSYYSYSSYSHQCSLRSSASAIERTQVGLSMQVYESHECRVNVLALVLVQCLSGVCRTEGLMALRTERWSQWSGFQTHFGWRLTTYSIT